MCRIRHVGALFMTGRRFLATAALAGCAGAADVREGDGMRYTVKRVAPASMASVAFESAEKGRVAQVRPESSDHRPETDFRVVHDDERLYVRFDVRDHYVRSVQTAYQAPVCTDSCVEFFVRPRPDKGYFNFEVNAGGTLLLYYIEDAARVKGGFRKFVKVPEEWGRQVEIRSSLPRVVDPERVGPLTWRVTIGIPLALFRAFVGEVPLSGAVWRANFYKCGDKTSHPHWLSWSPVPELNFHLPEAFGELALE